MSNDGGCATLRCWAGLTLLLPALGGCAVVKASQQPEKRNVNLLHAGTPRTHLIAEFGPPMWTEQRDDELLDVFAFRQGYSREAKAGRVLVHCAADVVTWGLWEVVGTPLETWADGTEVRIEVCYDRDQRVRQFTVLRGEDVVKPKGPQVAQDKPLESSGVVKASAETR